MNMCKVPSADILLAGFVCKSVSRENIDRGKHAACISQQTGATGSTFGSLMAYVGRHRPKLVICENVEGLTQRINGNEAQICEVQRVFEVSSHLTLTVIFCETLEQTESLRV
eukprot:773430-Amphidinium_carterae.1